MDCHSISIERYQRLVRFDDRRESLEDTLTLLAAQTSGQLRDERPNPHDALAAR